MMEEWKMVKVYCYSRCTTCKKALKWLDDNGIPADGNSKRMDICI